MRILKAKFLIEPKLQLTVTTYILFFSAISFICFYLLIRASLSDLSENSATLNAACSAVMKNYIEDLTSLSNSNFVISFVAAMIFSFMGGILISHRIVGPIFRLRRVMEQIRKHEPIETDRLRKNDFFQDLIPQLKELLKEIEK